MWNCNTFLQVLFDLSLARGLDYYTGIIYEAILLGKLNSFSCAIYPLKAIYSLTL